MARPVTLFVSPFLWTMQRASGVPTFYETVKGFAARGETHLLLPATRTATEKAGGVTFHLFRLHLWARWLDFGPDRSIFSYRLPGGRLGRYLLDKLLWLQFLIEALVHGARLARRFHPTVYYGVTPYGAPVAFLLRLACGGINVTRLLGTFLTRAASFGSGPWNRLRMLLWLAPRFTEALAFRIPSAALVITDDGTRGAAVAGALGRAGACCWRNGIDVPSEEELARRPGGRAALARRLDLDPARTWALYVGQLVAWKRVDRLLEAVALLSPGERDRMAVLIVGDGPERGRLEELARALDVTDTVSFCGAAARRDLLDYYLAADLFVAPHDLTCACNATFEAMAAALPVLATDCGDTGSVLSHGIEGWLTNPSAAALAAALGKILGETALLAPAGRRARARILSDFGSWEARIGREYNLVSGLAAGGSRPGPGLPRCLERSNT